MDTILILGSQGMVGGALRKVFPQALAWDREECDVTDFEDLRLKIENINPRPAVIINCVAYNNVDGAERDGETALLLNAEFPKQLAKICSHLDTTLIHFSSNYVFDGEKGEYTEADEPHPLSQYSHSKYEGERNVEKICKKHFIVRTSVVFGPAGHSSSSKKSFVDIMLDLSHNHANQIKAVKDEVNSVTYVEDLAAQVKLLTEGSYEYGIYHIVNSGQASWYELAKEIFILKKRLVELLPVSASSFPRHAVRPAKAVLMNTKLPHLRNWQQALKEYLTSNE